MHKIIFVTGPQGCGKTLHRKALSTYLNSTVLLDEGEIFFPTVARSIDSALKRKIPQTIVVLTNVGERQLRRKFGHTYKEAAVEVRQFSHVLLNYVSESFPDWTRWVPLSDLHSILDASNERRKSFPEQQSLPKTTTIKIDECCPPSLAKLNDLIRAEMQSIAPRIRLIMTERPAWETPRVELTQEEILKLKDLLSREKLSPADRHAKGEALAQEAYAKACKHVGRREADAVVNGSGHHHISDVKGKVGFRVHQLLTRLIEFGAGGTSRYTKE